MARLRQGEKSSKEYQVKSTLGQKLFGIRESELADELGWGRRTLNNYLRVLQEKGDVYKEGRDWFRED